MWLRIGLWVGLSFWLLGLASSSFIIHQALPEGFLLRWNKAHKVHQTANLKKAETLFVYQNKKAFDNYFARISLVLDKTIQVSSLSDYAKHVRSFLKEQRFSFLEEKFLSLPSSHPCFKSRALFLRVAHRDFGLQLGQIICLEKEKKGGLIFSLSVRRKDPNWSTYEKEALDLFKGLTLVSQKQPHIDKE